MAKSFIRGVAAVAVAFGGLVLAGCNTSCCTPCQPGPAVYKKPCCAGGQMMAAPAPAPMPQPAPAPAAPAAGSKACGAGKCG